MQAKIDQKKEKYKTKTNKYIIYELQFILKYFCNQNCLEEVHFKD